MKKQLWQLAVGLVLVCLVACVLTGCAGSEPETSQEKILKIGVSISMTGPLSREGILVRDAYRFWAEYVNSKGGIKVGNDRYKIQLVEYDDESDPNTSVKLTEKLITQDKVNFLFSPYGSGQTFATSAIGEKYGILTVASSANAEKIYTRGYKNIFCVFQVAGEELVNTVDLLNELNPRPKTIGIAVNEDLWPLPVGLAVKDRAEKLGFQIVGFHKYPKGVKDGSAILLKLKEANPDVLYLIGYFDDETMFLKQAKELKLSPKAIVMSSSPRVPDFVEVMGPLSENIFSAVAWKPGISYQDPVFGSSDNFVAAWKEKFDTEPNHYAASGTSVGVALQCAIEKAGSIDTDAVREAFRIMEIETIFGKMKWDDRGLNVALRWPAIQIQGGSRKIVYPVSLRETDPVYPKIPW